MYAIRKTRFFFGPREEKSYVIDNFASTSHDVRAEFRVRAAAEAVRQQLDDAVYHTAHNESGRPDYKVVRIG